MDYDDWSLDGDLMIWDKTRDKAIEISSMTFSRRGSSALKKSFEG